MTDRRFRDVRTAVGIPVFLVGHARAAPWPDKPIPHTVVVFRVERFAPVSTRRNNIILYREACVEFARGEKKRNPRAIYIYYALARREKCPRRLSADQRSTAQYYCISPCFVYNELDVLCVTHPDMSWLRENSMTWTQRFCAQVLTYGEIPKHVAFIMDGNRRYAKKKNVDKQEGHMRG